MAACRETVHAVARMIPQRHFGGEAFLKETPFTLILVEFTGVDTLFLSRLIGAEPDEVTIGMKVRARFLRNCKFKPTDVYFVPA